MPRPRKPLFVNFNESQTDQQLRRLETSRPARVAVKLRVADVLRIERSGLSDDEYKFALMAHFDNVVYDARPTSPQPLFAVEFDGASHSEPSAQRRDALKDSICNHFSFPILRIDADFLRKRTNRDSLLTWLSELWFEYLEFEEAQRRGDIPLEAVFHYDFMFLSPANSFRSIWDSVRRRIAPDAYGDSEDTDDDRDDDRDDWDDDDEDDDRAVTYRPFALFGTDRWALGSAQNAGIIRGKGELTSGIVNGRAAACLVLKVDDGFVVGKGSCKRFDFPPISDLDVAQELALKDADEKFTRWLGSLDRSLSRAEVDHLQSRIEPSADPPVPHGPLYVKTFYGFSTMDKIFDVAEREITRSLGESLLSRD